MARSCVALLAGVWVFASASAAECPVARPVSVGVVPQQAPSDLARAWLPILSAISKRSGCTFRFATAPTIPEFEKRTAAGEYDIAYMNPYHYTVFSQSPGYRAFAKEKGRALKGLLVAAKGGPVKRMADLDGLKVAFPSPAAFAATIIPLAEMKKAGVSVEPVYVASHDSVYLNVSRGFYPAGGGIVRTLNAIAPAVRDRLQVIWESQAYAPHAFAALPGLDARVRTVFFDGMQALESDASGQAMLHVLRFKGIEAAADADWDPIRALDLHVIAQPPGQ
ncbi:phosphate/phosphite/phosphonate ABC transporter substrate-binding protein [Nitrogeniibacter mangrovi]|uniref:Phosphate/phosphite/phosphonate ABC transporter substrate-binding protein n=1 Tax=Nitrogeniibacter mangrovi TaxID=2016596 RepID=A0A6C1B4J4_9RHOO|nr:phosphate/phosphite/phosphonate ABC transporter substrate-binding protein [Nitrogeniibacter mangrovi]QID18407.1 phosphate/phosphite/phosphonate ABC transporter substrate-binding protein [Nitrogeniibacter mangrovi]